MAEIQGWQIKSIYALAGGLGMVERDNHDDALHQLVAGMTGETSIKALDSAAANDVLTELRERMRLSNAPIPPQKRKARPKEDTPNGVTKGQQNKIWALMYELAKHDTAPATAGVGVRLCGIIKRQFGMDSAPRQPFRFLSREQADKLIELLKHYVETAQERQEVEAHG